MSLNVKSNEAHALARELAELTGESLTATVTTALRERLDRVRKSKAPDTAARMLAIAAEFSRDLPEPWRSLDHADLLYDDKGLPK